MTVAQHYLDSSSAQFNCRSYSARGVFSMSMLTGVWNDTYSFI
uniref:Uncharacterized protein n=1 Tax=Anguilla anguilla TaxID=7936 RepID=A0A0E9VGE8_ANGAN